MPVAGKVSKLEIAERAATIEHVVTIEDATGGTFKLGFHSGDETDDMAFDVAEATMKSELEGLTNISGSVTVNELAGVYTIQYAAVDGKPFLVITDDSLTGAGASIEIESEFYATPDAVGGRVDWNLNIDKTEIDAGHMDVTEGLSPFLQGRKNCSISGTLRYIEDDAGQETLIDNSFSSGDRIFVVFSFDDPDNYTAPDTPTEWHAEGFVTNINPSPPDEDVANMSFTIRLDEVKET